MAENGEGGWWRPRAWVPPGRPEEATRAAHLERIPLVNFGTCGRMLLKHVSFEFMMHVKVSNL
jgi:hypothetical protein